MEFDIGAETRCTGGHAGKVVALIADPVAKALVHIAIEPERHGASEQQLPVLVDRVPAGEVGIRRHEPVHAADGGAIGQVEGLVVDGESHITHVLLQEGHLWGRKEVAIPIGSLEKIDADGIHVRLSKSEIGDLPELGVHRTW